MKRCSKKNLTELEWMLLARKLKIATDEDKHRRRGRVRGLTIDGGDAVLALPKGKTSELGYNILSAQDFLALKAKHGSILIEVSQRRPVGIEG